MKIKINHQLLALILVVLACLIMGFSYIVLSIATFTGTTDLCEIIRKDWRDDCYESIAKKYNAPSLCNQIKHPDLRDRCYLRIAWNLKYDASICDKIQDNITRDECYIAPAANNDNISLCDKMKTDSWKNKCYGYIKTNQPT